ncbi:MAG: type II toxin-antitoxin system PemK/MazF family toxin [Candidatus Acidiferrales bacterium]|jgi:mRNA interferase MazF
MQKTRPAIIISNNGANTALNRLIAVPLTSQIAKVYPGQAMVTVNGEPRKAMADQLTTASKKRLRSKLGELSSSDVSAVESAILLHLGMRR